MSNEITCDDNDEDNDNDIKDDDDGNETLAIEYLQYDVLKIEGVDDDNSGVEMDSEGVENGGGVVVDANWIPTNRKVYSLCQHPNINYNDERSTWRSMGWINLIMGSRALHNVSKAYANVFNSITTFVEPTP